MGITFEWDDEKEKINIQKHNVSFYECQEAFFDPNRVIAKDMGHSAYETRYYCFGKIEDEIMTVRFTFRDNRIRIIGAGYWRKGRKIYEKAQN